MGTMTLVLLGDGVVANVTLKKSYAYQGGWMVITSGWAFAVFCGVFIAQAFGSPAAYINPAVLLAAAVSSGQYSNVLPYATAEVFGGMAGAFLVWIHFLPHWKATEDAPTAKLACFCTVPAIPNLAANMISEIIGTMVLVLVVTAIFSRHVTPMGPVAGVGPYLVAALVWGIGLSLGGTTGYAINPARDLGPRIAHAILPIAGKGRSNWSYAVVPVIGPTLGALLSGLIIKVAQI
jgi:glycerol uptake facilitator protein